jgi:hypothetical protein
MRKTFSSGFQILFTPEALIPFLIGSLALAIAGSALFQLIVNWIGTNNLSLVGLFVASLLVLIGAAWTLSVIVHRLKPCPPLLNKTAPEKRKGLILLVSNEPSARKAIEWHRGELRFCWMFCSDQPQSSGIAGRLKDELIRQGMDARILLINDVYDPLEYKDQVERIYAELPSGLEESDLILDYTGMTACASVGTVLACLHENRRIQYTPAQFDPSLKALQPLDPIEVSLRWEGYFEP